MKLGKKVKNILGLLTVLLILFFLGKILLNNWQKVKEYQFEVNYIAIVASFFVFSFAMATMGLIWNKILKALDEKRGLSNFEAFKIVVYARFGRYLPGKVWGILGRVYLGNKHKIQRKTLFASSILDMSIGVVCSFLVGLILVKISFGREWFFIYFLLMGVVLLAAIISYPKYYCVFLNYIFKKIKKNFAGINYSIGKKQMLSVFSFCGAAQLMNGLAFFIFIFSVTGLAFSIHNIAGISGAYLLAGTLGMLAIFAPSGLGIREGILVALLQYYFPLSIAVLLSLLARIWAVANDVLLFAIVFMYNKIIANKK